MTQVIIYTNESGGINVTIPTPEFLENNTIEDVLAKDCPENAIIVDNSMLPAEDEFFNAWELINGQVIVNETKKQAIIDAKQAVIDAKSSAKAKLTALGLTQDEIKALVS